MASESAQSGHLSTGGGTVSKDPRPPGPVGKHHQLALGKTNGQGDVQGVAISKAPTISNGHKGW